MKKNFWFKLKKADRPILALAPLAGFTDSAFRQICCKFGADVVYSEMASAAALYYNQGHNDSATLGLLKFDRSKEKYYVVQLFGSQPEHFAVAAKIITEKIRPDGIDINFGCPVQKIIKQGAGSGLMKNLAASRQAIEAVLANTDLPVSLKIRTQAGKVRAADFLKNVSDLPISAVMVHGRSLAQGFAGAADWEIARELKKIYKGVILINGGINSLTEARKALRVSGAHGLGLARGALGRPWLFREIKNKKAISLKPKQIFKIAIAHAELEKKQKGSRGIIEYRKHLVWYVQGLNGAAKMRERLVGIKSVSELKKAACALAVENF